MVELNHTAAYIRKASVVSVPPDELETRLDAEILTLLASAHTVESLSRKVGHRRENESELLGRDIAASMHRLLEAELIELSPDS
ncbi:MAG TPA: hypothetical protein VFR96_13875 [Povalibacter sp.]|nr:hypothetical protein [Povalibacter sp.]